MKVCKSCGYKWVSDRNYCPACNKSLNSKTYIIAYSDYMGEDPCMESKEADSVKDLVLDLMGRECEEDVEEWFDMPASEVPVDDVIRMFQEQNGDGMPYICVWDVDNDEQVI